MYYMHVLRSNKIIQKERVLYSDRRSPYKPKICVKDVVHQKLTIEEVQYTTVRVLINPYFVQNQVQKKMHM